MTDDVDEIWNNEADRLLSEEQQKVRFSKEERMELTRWLDKRQNERNRPPVADPLAPTTREHLRWRRVWHDDGSITTHAWDVRDELECDLGDYDFVLENTPVVPPGACVMRTHASARLSAEWFDEWCATEVWNTRRMWHENPTREVQWYEELAADLSTSEEDLAQCIDIMLGRTAI